MTKIIKLKNVRLSYPFLFQKYVDKNGEIGDYQCTLLFDKNDIATKAMLDQAIEQCKEDNNGVIKNRIVDEQHCFLKNGDNKDGDENDGMWVVKTKNRRRPHVVNRDRTPLIESDEVIYSGCYVNAHISLWFSNHERGGRQILANIHGVQFSKDGESLEGGVVNCEFDDLSDDDISDDEVTF
ncbi:hypothetical protein BJAS_P3398 [Bathymodiolus japonicus methanotrophic gill symbiont]|uniref:ssDNA-binding protein n=1 Tax=Bathymodiolus japonicus methanotrophic gill symbiont TaxID=113269 RepID=UPI001B70D84D|nr:ssDNA-binding protein [Bathymodiolus japonicus methanotrophic gill symbiont]GFO72864.1 hypothetical protein BJAS_P3398 [Bathymodiolus japonicus methanotrophic gill symbiont]